MSDIVVVGSMNMDLTVRAGKMPNGGETILGDEFHIIPGGKGANQAVAVSRLGGKVSMIAKIGADLYGKALRDQLVSDHVDDRFVITENDISTGVAFIVVEKTGENRIIVVPGANYTLSDKDLTAARAVFSQAKVVLTQLEIPMPTVERLIDLAKENGLIMVVNAAPVQSLSDETLRKIDYLVVNEHEAGYLSGIPVVDVDSASRAAKALVSRGSHCVVLTLGSEGSLYCSEDEEGFIPTFDVEVKDTTAAGDAFIGGFAVALLNPSLTLADRVAYGNAAGALATTKLGAQSSLPSLADVEKLIEINKRA